MKELSEERARRFAEVDGVDRFALVALDPEDKGEIVAVVRYEREAGHETGPSTRRWSRTGSRGGGWGSG